MIKTYAQGFTYRNGSFSVQLNLENNRNEKRTKSSFYSRGGKS